MSLTDRDKKIAMVLLPLVVLVGYWFLILAPQRNEVSSLDDQLVAAQAARDQSVGNVQRLEASRNGYAKDYETVVRLGKAIPSTLDMPSLLVQLESAAKGTGIDFDSITVGDRTTGTAAAPATSSGSSQPPVAAGGEEAKTGAGQSAEKANNAAETADSRNAAAGDNNQSSGQTGTDGSSAPASPVAGLDTVPLNFDFAGSYFELADFFHRIKRFVRVANSDIRVKGRLMTIDGMSLTSQGFPKISAKITATIYLSPKSEGTTGGATSQGPAATPASSTTGSTPSQTPASGSNPAPPATQNSSAPNQ